MLTLAQYWHDPLVPADIAARQLTWDQPADRHVVFNSRTAQEFLLQHFGEEAVIGLRACAAPAMASDYFRYHFLAVQGGVYVDSSFVCGDPVRFRKLLQTDLFIPSVPSVDLTPAIIAGRAAIGRMLLNGVIVAQPQASGYFRLLSDLVRRLVTLRTGESIPFVTGIGVLSIFDYALTIPAPSGEIDHDRLEPALALTSDAFRETFLAVLADSASREPLPAPCSSVDFRDVSDIFVRPAQDNARFQDASHWSNHQGSIYRR